MAKASKKPTVAELAARAKTSEELLKVVSLLEAELEAAEKELEQLEAGRKDVVFSGKTLDEYHAELRNGAEKVRTLGAGLEEARSRYDKALAKEAEENLLERTEAVKAKEVPALSAAYRKLHEAMKGVLEVTNEIEAICYEIESHNYLVERRERPDLAISISRIKNAVREDLGMPVEAVPEIERMEGESEEAFILRRGIAEQQAYRKSELSDPIKALGVQTMIALQNTTIDMGAHERERNFRLVSVQNYVMPDGHLVKKFIDVDPKYRNKHHKVHAEGVSPGVSGGASVVYGQAQAVA